MHGRDVRAGDNHPVPPQFLFKELLVLGDRKLIGQKVRNHHRHSVTDPPLCVDGGDETEGLTGNKHMATNTWLSCWWLETELAAPLAAAVG